MNTHPEALKAQMRAARRKRMCDAIKQAKANLPGLRFMHVGRYTVCYRIRRKDVFVMSTALCHPTDRNDRVAGKMQALTAYLDGRHATMRKPKSFESVKRFISFVLHDWSEET